MFSRPLCAALLLVLVALVIHVSAPHGRDDIGDDDERRKAACTSMFSRNTTLLDLDTYNPAYDPVRTGLEYGGGDDAAAECPTSQAGTTLGCQTTLPAHPPSHSPAHPPARPRVPLAAHRCGRCCRAALRHA